MPASVEIKETGKPGVKAQIPEIKFDWQGDEVSGVVPETGRAVVHGKVNRVVTVPGSGDNAPSTYDVALVDDNGVDILGGAGVGRSASARGHILVDPPVHVDGSLTLFIENQSNINGRGEVIVYVEPVA